MTPVSFFQIRNSIDGKILTLINHYEFVKKLMDYLEFVYSGKGNISRIFDVCRETRSIAYKIFHGL